MYPKCDWGCNCEIWDPALSQGPSKCCGQNQFIHYSKPGPDSICIVMLFLKVRFMFKSSNKQTALMDTARREKSEHLTAQFGVSFKLH
jgi:hypothetical protein